VPRGVFAFACCGLGHCCRLGLGSLCVHVRLVMHSSTITRVYSAAAVELQVSDGLSSPDLIAIMSNMAVVDPGGQALRPLSLKVAI
jgi:hypothetical protein